MDSPPLVAFGTMSVTSTSSVSHALASGVRHLDCAELYVESLPHVGRAIAESGMPRAALWVTSKLSGLPLGAYEAVKARVTTQCRQLSIDQFDLLLIHWPGEADADLTGSPDELAAKVRAEWFTANIGEAWTNMLRLRNEGYTRHVGVSNFYAGHLHALEAAAPSQPPFANQVFLDATHQEAPLVALMQARGIVPMAYRPLAFLPAIKMAADMGDGTHALLEAQSVACGADSIQQLILAWLARQGIVAVCSSSSIEHIKANLQAAASASRAPEILGGDSTGGNELVDMCGGHDEYAGVMRMSMPE